MKGRLKTAFLLFVGALAFTVVFSAFLLLLGVGSWPTSVKATFLFFSAPAFLSAFATLIMKDPEEEPYAYACAVYYGGLALGWLIGELTHDEDTLSICAGWVIAVIVAVVVYFTRREKRNERRNR